MDQWSDRAQAYVESDAHREGEDLDQLVAWAAGATTALDVATGGGHVATRLREAGLEVVTCDPAPGMRRAWFFSRPSSSGAKKPEQGIVPVAQ